MSSITAIDTVFDAAGNPTARASRAHITVSRIDWLDKTHRQLFSAGLLQTSGALEGLPLGRSLFFLALLMLSTMTRAHAFNSLVHEAITHSAFRHLEAYEHASPATARWTSELGALESFVEDLLARKAVDADYHTDLWADGWFHGPFTGATQGNKSSLFTGLTHFLNVMIRGDYWDYDGYAYRHGTQGEFDGYFGFPSFVPRGDLSTALGGKNPAHPVRGIDPGPYKTGFKGSEAEWRKMYDKSTPMSQVVFPPSDVAAQTAYDALMHSAPARKTFTESWNETYPMVSGVFDTSYRSRFYWRGEASGLPRGLDLLGLVLHLAQDLGIPQHAHGTADNCHLEIEQLVDRLACNTQRNPDQSPYISGKFEGLGNRCQFLYDPALVHDLRREALELDPKARMPLRERFQRLARMSARWWWGEPGNDVDFIATVLPDGRAYGANTCDDLMRVKAIQETARHRYNVAVAVTATLIEVTAAEYERGLSEFPSFFAIE